jgi:hypothetical protein
MNEFLILASPWRWTFARRDFFRRSLVDGAQGCFLQITGALVSRQHVAADGNCARLDFILSGAEIGDGW